MSLKQINDNLWIQELELGIFDVRGALVLGQNRAVVWDTLSHPRDMADYLPLIGDRDLFVVYSHADWDHIWGTNGLTPLPATIICHTLCRDRFQSEVPERLRKQQVEEPTKWDDVQIIPPTISFHDMLQIDLGGLRLTLHHLPGHTEDCLIALLPELGIALMGDTIETPFPVVPVDSPLDAWIANLKIWAADETITTVIPSHGPIGNRSLITQSIDYLEKLHNGAHIDVPEKMTDFYIETHESNLKWNK